MRTISGLTPASSNLEGGIRNCQPISCVTICTSAVDGSMLGPAMSMQLQSISVDVDVVLSLSFISFPALLFHMPVYPAPQSDHGRVPRKLTLILVPLSKLVGLNVLDLT
jgi:hypothetical protein